MGAVSFHPVWERWPSWLVELASGVGCAALAQIGAVVAASVMPHAWLVVLAAHVPFGVFEALIATAISCVYERAFDRNGWSWSDVGQRSVGIIIGLVLWSVFPAPLLVLPSLHRA